MWQFLQGTTFWFLRKRFVAMKKKELWKPFKSLKLLIVTVLVPLWMESFETTSFEKIE